MLRSSILSLFSALILVAACGGDDTNDSSGGAGGSGATDSGTGGSAAGGSGGSGACGPMPPGYACADPCNEYAIPQCTDAGWDCPPSACDGAAGGTGGTSGSGGSSGAAGSASGGAAGSGGASDAGVDGSACASDKVPTVEGCLSCSDASTKLSAAIEAARAANDSCGSASDCVMTSSNTACAGACGVPVSKSGEAAFQAALTKIDGDYCSGYVPVCGFTTPKCANPTLVCNAGSCGVVFN